MRRTGINQHSGCIRLTLLLAAVGALFLIPAAQAFAAGTETVSAVGSGSGELSSAGGFFGEGEGEPTIECTYASPGPATGSCATTMTVIEEEFEGVMLFSIPAVGSKLTAWTVEGAPPSSTNCNPGSTFEGLHYCYVATALGANPTVKVTATICLEGQSEEECLSSAATSFPLTVTPEGTGEGTVTSTPAGINCGSECEAEFEEGEEVELSQSAETGSEFTGWSGDCTGTGSCKVTMSEAKEVTATFDLEPTPEFALEINTDGTGEGEVSCEVESGPAEPCAAEYEEGTEVALVPEAETGSEFVEWSGDCTGSGACELTIDEAKSITATFDLEPTPEFELTIVKAGTGSGSVTCNAGACASEYPEGTEVTLAASAASGSTFSGWSGGGCSGTGSCVVAINADTTVTATFTANPKPEETCATNASLCPPPPPAEVKCTVPKLAKKSLGQAKSALKAAHCALGKVTKPKKKSALVVKSSKPGAGTSLAAGAKVDLKLGPKPKKKH